MYKRNSVEKALDKAISRDAHERHTKPCISQISSLVEALQKEEAVSRHFILEDAYERLSDGIVSIKQYNYILHLFYSNNKIKLCKVLSQFLQIKK